MKSPTHARNASERGFALVTALAILAIFLAVCFLILTMSTQNSQNLGNAYQKQRYYDVAEAGIDRGLADLDSTVPTPPSTATPGAPPPTPSANQTALPNIPNVAYYYSYWYNNSSVPTSIPDPLAGHYNVSTGHIVNVPAFGGIIWAHTATANRDVGVEAVVSRFGTSSGSCAICAGQSITATGSDKFSAPPTVCGDTKKPYKICSDPNASPGPAPTTVPLISGGSYTCSGAEPAPCTLTPTAIQTNAPSGVTSGFLASQASIAQLSNAAAWYAASTTNSNIKYIVCSGGCDTSVLQPVAPSVGQITFVNGDISISSKTVLTYGGTFIVSGCLNVSQPGMQGTSSVATTIVLGTDASCGGNAANFQGGGNTLPPLWNYGLLYAAQGSVNIAGNGSVKGYNFYGAIIAANSVTIAGNGFFAWESASSAQPALHLGPFTIASFAQY